MRAKEEVLDYAKKRKENQPIWVKKDPNIPLRIVAPNPVGFFSRTVWNLRQSEKPTRGSPLDRVCRLQRSPADCRNLGPR
jgi:hypothetical protein